MRQRRPKTVEQLEACIRQEWDNIPIPKLEQLVSSVPTRLQTVIKRRGDYIYIYAFSRRFYPKRLTFRLYMYCQYVSGCHTVVNMALSQLFWDVLMPWNLKSTYFSLKIIHFLSLNIWYVIYVVFWIKYWNLKLPHHCILFLFTICTVSQLFWNRVCISLHLFLNESALLNMQLNERLKTHSKIVSYHHLVAKQWNCTDWQPV